MSDREDQIRKALTPSQLKVYDLRQEGKTFQQIADALGCSAFTVGSYWKQCVKIMSREMKMTRVEFIEHLKAINPKAVTDLDNGGVFLPVVCSFIAGSCWVEQRPEDEHTAALRYQLKYLAEKGCFDFKDE